MHLKRTSFLSSAHIKSRGKSEPSYPNGLSIELAMPSIPMRVKAIKVQNGTIRQARAKQALLLGPT